MSKNPTTTWTGRWSVFDHKKDNKAKERGGTTKDLIAEISPYGEGKEGKKFCFAVFKDQRNRKLENVRHCYGIVLDFDESTTVELLSLSERLPCYYIAHSSFRDNNEGKRKYRVLIPTKEPLQPLEHELLFDYLNVLFPDSLDDPDPQSRVPNMIYNTQRTDAQENWVIESPHSNILDPQDLPAGGNIRDLVNEYEEEKARSKKELEERSRKNMEELGREPSEDAKRDYANNQLAKAISTIQNLPSGDRNRNINKEAYCIGALIKPCKLDEADVTRQLIDAGIASGHDPASVKTTVKSAIKKGLEANWTVNHIKEKKQKKEPSKSKPYDSDHAYLASGFSVTNNGLFYLPKSERSKEKDQKWTRVSSYIKVVALTRDDHNQGWGRLLEIEDRDGVKKEWAMPMELTATEGAEYRRTLLNLGLELSAGPQAKNLLTTYITNSNPKKRARCAPKVGWYRDVYVLPDRVIGESEERIIYQSETPGSIYQSQGEHKDWVNEVSKRCCGNSRLIMSICTGLASALLGQIESDSGGFHIKGQSSTGKSTALRCAASMYSNHKFIRQWRATDNALEAIASQQNDGLLILDELGQNTDPRSVGNITYMLANGTAKARSTRSGVGMREQLTWRLLYLSSGELGLTELLDRVNQKAQAGMEVRFLEIPADAGAGMGLFENIHDCSTADEFSDKMRVLTAKYHGTLFPLWIEKLVKDQKQLFSKIHNGKKEFIKSLKDPSYQGQVIRALDRFALLAVAGEMATEYGLTGWESGEATYAVSQCFLAWMMERGGGTNLEEIKHLETVRLFLQQHENSRFQNFDSDVDHQIYNRAGYFTNSAMENEKLFLIFPEVFSKEICKALDFKAVSKTLEKHNFLLSSKNSMSKTVSRHGKKKRFYVIRHSIINTFSEFEGSDE